MADIGKVLLLASYYGIGITFTASEIFADFFNNSYIGIVLFCLISVSLIFF
jgi:hypothetical protein